MSTITGNCLCSSDSYTADTEPIMVALCHCQRQSGAPYSLNVAVDRGALELSGAPMKTVEMVGADSGQRRERIFSSDCGSPLVSILAEADDMAFIKAGTLDDSSWLTPELEVITDSAQGWVHATDNDERGRFPRSIPT